MKFKTLKIYKIVSQQSVTLEHNTQSDREKQTQIRTQSDKPAPKSQITSKMPLLITKDTTRNDLDQGAKKSTVEQGRGNSPLTKRQEGRGYSPLTKRQEERGYSPLTKRQGVRGHRQEGSGDSPLTTIEEGRGYRPQKDKGNLGGNKLKS